MPPQDANPTPSFGGFGLRFRASVGSQSPQPHLEDSSTYHPLRPTRLDKIKNLHAPVQVGGVERGTVKRARPPFTV